MSPLGYCDRNFRLGCASGLYFLGAERDECCDETPLEGVFEFDTLGSDLRSVSIMGGFGDLDGLECLDIAEGLREDGKDESDVLRLGATLSLELHVVAVVSTVPVVPLVVGRVCMAARASFVDCVLR